MTTPPIDKNGEMTRANTLLKRWRKDLDAVPEEWARWIAESLVAPFRDPERDTQPDGPEAKRK